MKQYSLEEILTPRKPLSPHASARWDSKTERIVISWFGTEYSTEITGHSDFISTEGDLAQAILKWAYEKIPVHKDELSTYPTYLFYDPNHKRDCLAVARSLDPETHRCATGKLPPLETLPLLNQPTVGDFHSNISGSLVCIRSKKFRPAACLSMTKKEFESLLSLKFKSSTGLYAVSLPKTILFGTEETMRRYKDTDITGEARLITAHEIEQLFLRRKDDR